MKVGPEEMQTMRMAMTGLRDRLPAERDPEDAVQLRTRDRCLSAAPAALETIPDRRQDRRTFDGRRRCV